ncbi:teneurin-3-like, partial [Sinocyclocheilus anshuiensis]|uniref:teneurin-3-like n=1 Tax=Sinocyclocheilus anshuiensis TaxID=1608454 RepID=UPI0007B7C790
MEVKERRPYCAFSRSRRERGRDWEREEDREEGEGYREGPGNRRHTGSSSVLTQKSYSSSETLKAFDQHPSTQGLYGHRMLDMVPRDTEEYRAPGQSLSLRQLGICGPAPRRGLSFCAETGLSHHTQLSGADQIQNAGGIPPDCAMLWVKTHGRDAQLSCRSNSALALTDTEQDNKSGQENDQLPSQAGPPPLPPAPHQHKQHPSVTSLNQSLANQPTELQSASECVQLQENWVLGGNVGLEN